MLKTQGTVQHSMQNATPFTWADTLKVVTINKCWKEKKCHYTIHLSVIVLLFNGQTEWAMNFESCPDYLHVLLGGISSISRDILSLSLKFNSINWIKRQQGMASNCIKLFFLMSCSSLQAKKYHTFSQLMCKIELCSSFHCTSTLLSKLSGLSPPDCQLRPTSKHKQNGQIYSRNCLFQ